MLEVEGIKLDSGFRVVEVSLVSCRGFVWFCAVGLLENEGWVIVGSDFFGFGLSWEE